MASLVELVVVPFGDNGFFQGLFQSVTDFGSFIKFSSTFFINSLFAIKLTLIAPKVELVNGCLSLPTNYCKSA
jgi:hypothetical protein